MLRIWNGAISIGSSICLTSHEQMNLLVHVVDFGQTFVQKYSWAILRSVAIEFYHPRTPNAQIIATGHACATCKLIKGSVYSSVLTIIWVSDFYLKSSWFILIIFALYDGGWCSMTMDDAQWWWIMANDCGWCSMTVDDAQWLSMTVDDAQWLGSFRLATYECEYDFENCVCSRHVSPSRTDVINL